MAGEGPVRVGESLVTKRKQAECRSARLSNRCAEERLCQTQQIEAAGVLTGGIAHDLNNLLSVILTCTVLVIEELKPVGRTLSDLEEVCVAAERAAALTRQLLMLGKQSRLCPCA